MTNLAIISIANNQKLVAQMRESACNTNGVFSCSFIILDNRDNHLYNSASSAYNAVLEQAPDAEVYVFCHQDIVFLKHSLQDIFRLCREEPCTLFGAAGVENVGHGGEGRIISSMAAVQEGWNFQTLKKGTTQEVFSLDECLICGSRELFSSFRFDEEVCDGWHLYAAELSMQCHVKGTPVKVFDADIVHLSGGSLDKSFYRCERKLVKKYRKYFPVISYTCGWAYTNPIKYGLLALYRKLRYRI